MKKYREGTQDNGVWKAGVQLMNQFGKEKKRANIPSNEYNMKKFS